MDARVALDELIGRARAGDRRALARLISTVEDERDDHEAALAELYRSSGSAWTLGVTGAPGAGKSTLVDAVIAGFRARGSSVGVLAVDPTSPFSGGAILGDRVRMQDHIDDDGVYIRSMANRGHLGGLSAATPRAIVALDGVGFDEIIVETVGVGQAEVEISGAADTTVVVVNPGWGDSVQAAKAGLLEIGDVFVVNKADRPGLDEAVRDLRQMLSLGEPGPWSPPVLATVATSGDGVPAVIDAVEDHRRFLSSGGELTAIRADRAVHLFEGAVERLIRRRFGGDGGAGWREMEAAVAAGQVDPWSAARAVVEATSQ